jgi:hypothetical protein
MPLAMSKKRLHNTRATVDEEFEGGLFLIL